ncbi:MAG TPA: TldD/PmbA family protein [Bacteroidales bacterium]|nr:TldD/PmbA family protein [Bacteroidales bacterium]
MNNNQRMELARWVSKYALEKGATESAVSISRSRSVQVDVREQRLDTIRENTENSLTLMIYRDFKFSTHTTNNLDRGQLEKFIAGAVEATSYLAPDPDRRLPDPSLYPTNLTKNLELLDPRQAEVTPEFRVQNAMEAEQLVRAVEGRANIASASAGFGDNLNEGVRVHSNGFAGEWSSTSFGLSASLSIIDGTARPAGGAFARTRFLNQLPSVREIAEEASRNTLMQIGQGPVETGKYTMLLDNRVAGNIIGRIFGPMSARNIHQKNSFLLNKLDSKIGSELFTITDDPFIPQGLGSRLFDGEGIAARRRVLIDKGVLKSYLIDNYFGRKLGLTPNGGSTSNIVFALGSRNSEQIIAAQERAILVNSFSGGNASALTGDFSFGISGHLIENGKITRAINEMNISGNLLDLWNQLVETGNDPFRFSATQSPTLVFADVIFSGL